MKNLAPIVIFAFNRPYALQKMLESLQLNPLFKESLTFIFVDGARNQAEQIKVNQVITIARSVTPNVFVSDKNIGLGASIISGVSQIINKYGKAIVLEDDLYLMPGFLSYMNDALVQYKSDERIFSICGYGLKVKRPKDYTGDVYLGIRSSSWGWATWSDRWNTVDWEVKDWDRLSSNRKLQKAFNEGGSDMYGMLKGYKEGKICSWAIRFCYSQHKQHKYSVHPFLSYVENYGFGDDATNCRSTHSRFKVILNRSLEKISMPKSLSVVKSIVKGNAFYHSIFLRVYNHLIEFI